jgi:hypothetical protein
MEDSTQHPSETGNHEPLTFEDVRGEVERNQRSILWEDQFRNNRTVTTFLWHGNPKAKPVQRAGLIVFAVFQLMLCEVAIDSWFHAEPDDRSPAPLIFAAVMLLIAINLLRNAFMRAPKHVDAPADQDE